ncbi:ATP-binding cassette domain-containing protein [Xylanimonas ulmi]|uniref:Monosaccharide ABC transporter ATP-binding protein (CUT2 family) n=1 Tax=Xylanimonas ulmi TaxID=228973 RepID=A0A4Q7M4M8_9MICO|nr:ATP-binding cassette domain-containing protein [Xylanibacterium ulmi]RZS60949.1 monosaccharide ABC transporter ATP-binding protein (CUT2 family) [Xylanibacterium ulmi]
MTADTHAAPVTPVLSATGLTKRYGSVVAMQDADFELLPGEVLAVIGDNGAGKSTLIKALSGVLIPDAGQIRVGSTPVTFRSARDAQSHGIETVFQDLALTPALDIAANLFMGRELRRSGLLGSVLRMTDKPAMRRRSQEFFDEMAIRVKSVAQPVESLSGGQRQGVAVARAVAFGRRVIIMDEPTAALGVRESDTVIELIKRIRSRGIPVVLISHDMPHVFEVADRVHVHRQGRRAAVVRPGVRSMAEVVALMTGALEPTEEERRGIA